MTISSILSTLDYGVAPESDTAAREWLAAHDGTFGHYVGGAWRNGKAHFDAFSPSTGEPLAQIAQGQRRRGRRRGRRPARPPGVERHGRPRPRALPLRARPRLQKHSRLFAVLETLDNGKPIRESRDIDMPLVARHFYHHAGWAELMQDASSRATAPSASSGRSSRGTSRS